MSSEQQNENSDFLLPNTLKITDVWPGTDANVFIISFPYALNVFNNCQSFKNTSFLKKSSVTKQTTGQQAALTEQVLGMTFFTSQRWSTTSNLGTQKKIATLPFALKRKLAICFLFLQKLLQLIWGEAALFSCQVREKHGLSEIAVECQALPDTGIQGCRAGSAGLYLASDAGRGKPASSNESSLSLQHAVNGNDSQPCVKLGKRGMNANTSSYYLPSLSVRRFWEKRRGKQSTEQVRGRPAGKEQVEASGRTRWGAPDVQS